MTASYKILANSIDEMKMIEKFISKAKLKFEKAIENDEVAINPDIAFKINSAENDIKEGKTVKINLKDLWK